MQCSKEPRLFDQLVGAQEEGFWNLKPDRLRGGQIDNQLKLGRLHDREVAWLRPTQDFVNVLGRAAKLIIPVDTIGYQGARCYKLVERTDVGHPISPRQRDYQRCVGVDDCVRKRD
jgi:hypothetical protein